MPFELAQPWHGKWDSLPAAHGAATLFDLLCIAGLLMLGWQLSGLRLGIGLALAWAAFPFTAYALESNSNDSLVAAMLIWGLVRGATSARARPDAGPRAGAPSSRPRCCCRSGAAGPSRAGAPGGELIPYGAGLALAVGADRLGAAAGRPRRGARPSGRARSGYQLGRDSPFSIWGQYPGLRPVQIGLMVRRGAWPPIAVLRWPRRLDLLTMTRPVGRAAHRPRADRDPLVLPLHPVVPALRAGGDGARTGRPRPATPAPRPTPRASPGASRCRWAHDERAGRCPVWSWRWPIVVWAVPLQLGFYADAVITDIPTYRAALRPHRRPATSRTATSRSSTRRWPPASSGWPGRCPGLYGVASRPDAAGACAPPPLGVVALARALGLDQRRQALAGVAVAVAPLLVGNLVETRFDLALAALLVVDPLGGRHRALRLMWGLLAAAILLKLVPLALIPVFVIWQRHRAGTRPRAWAGAAGSLAVVVAVIGAVRGPVALGHLGPRPRTTSTARSSSSRSARPTCWACTRWPTSPSRSRARSAARASTEPARR